MPKADDIRVIHTMGLNNCGGRCVIHAHVRGGEIVKLTTDSCADAEGGVPLTACARGMNYVKTMQGADRLRYPMKRVGARGEGRFERIGWDEALDIIASEWVRIRDTYGPDSRYVNYATGVSGVLCPYQLAQRLLALDGGYLGRYNSYSTACIGRASELIYGTTDTGNMPEDWLNSRLIILWGHNPAETRFDAPTMHYLRLAKQSGIPIVAVDPRRSDTALQLDAEWIPIRPATDAAMLDAMAWVIAREGLIDRDFLDRCCVGFDRAHMPAGIDPTECVLDYLNGTRDGIPKTPEWAAAITGVPAATIRSLALRYASAKPAALVQGYGAQRHAYGEQGARGGILLACMTGNVGVPGGWAAGHGDCARHAMPAFPVPENPCRLRIPSFLWTEAVLRGHELTALDGVKGGDRLNSDIRMIVNLAGNCLINQHGDVNRTSQILRDTSRCEFILCSDLFMTASAKFADILLPGTSMFESNNMTMPWKYGDFVGFNNKVLEPLGECRFEYDWLRDLAGRLGLEPRFSEGRTGLQWLEHIYGDLRAKEPELPDFDAFRAAGIHRYRANPPVIAFAKQRLDPERHPFPTPSGKVELFSESVYRARFRDFFPAIPRYVRPPEGADDPLAARWPLQLIGWHTKRRCHSIHDNNPALARLDPQRLWLNPEDARARGLADGDEALAFNDRGRLRLPVTVSDRLMPGVAAVSQGAWYRPDETGTDAGGCINVLTSLRPTPYARGNSQHTVLAQVEKLPPEAALRGLRVLCLGGDAMAGIDGRSFVEDVAARYGCDMTKCVAPGGTLADCLRLGEAPAEAAPFDLLLCELPAAGAGGDVARLLHAIAVLSRERLGCPAALLALPPLGSDAYDAWAAQARTACEAEGVHCIDLWNDPGFNNLPARRFGLSAEDHRAWLAPRVALGLRRVIGREALKGK